MAKLCKYYVRGTCKYGSRCHFLHEKDNSYYQENSYGSEDDRNYAFENSNRYTSYDNYSRHTSYDNSGRYTSYNTNKNYNRYHVDNRYHNASQIKSISELPFSQIMDLILRELQQFEERHVWKLTAIKPLRDFGNIPIFKDFSPEEIRYQYYECQKTNSTYEFEQMYKELIDHVRQCLTMFFMNSREAQDLVKKMMQQSANQNEEMAAEFTFDSAPSNLFNSNSSSMPKSFVSNQVTTHSDNVSSTSNLLRNSTFGSYQNSDNRSVFGSNEVPHTRSSTSFLNHSIFGTNSNYQENSLSHSKLNSFSFDIRNIETVNSNNDPLLSKPHIPETNSSLLESVYSKLEELPSDIKATFQAKTFKYGQIPLMAPPKEMCFG